LMERPMAGRKESDENQDKKVTSFGQAPNFPTRPGKRGKEKKKREKKRGGIFVG